MCRNPAVVTETANLDEAVTQCVAGSLKVDYIPQSSSSFSFCSFCFSFLVLVLPLLRLIQPEEFKLVKWE